MNEIRIWKLGSLEHKINPTQGAAQRLAKILSDSLNDGALDLIWGPDIELITVSADGKVSGSATIDANEITLLQENLEKIKSGVIGGVITSEPNEPNS
jgi:hypothetical protein